MLHSGGFIVLQFIVLSYGEDKPVEKIPAMQSIVIPLTYNFRGRY